MTIELSDTDLDGLRFRNSATPDYCAANVTAEELRALLAGIDKARSEAAAQKARADALASKLINHESAEDD